MTTQDKIRDIAVRKIDEQRYRHATNAPLRILIDVFDYMEIVEAIEKEFFIKIQEPEIAQFDNLTLEMLVDYYTVLVSKPRCNLHERIEQARKEYSAWLNEEIKRRPRGYTSKMVASLGITYAMFSLYRKGSRYPNRETQKKIKEYLTANA